MATWDKFNYGPEARHWGESWIPAGVNGTGAALIYFPGADFESASTEALYDAATGEAFFLDQILTREASGSVNERTCCFSINTAQHRYDSSHGSTSAWADSTFVFGDYASNGGSNYLCIRGHASGSSAVTEPGTGSSWADYWRVSPANDVGAKNRPTFSAQTPAYGASGISDAMLAYNYIVDHASQFGFDPTKVVLMGQGAGGQKMSGIVWNIMGTQLTSLGPALFNPNRVTVEQRPAGAIFRQCFDTLVNYPNSVVATGVWGANLIGRPFTSGEWTAYPDDRKSSISPQGILDNSTDANTPCYYEYVTTGEWHDDGVDNTPPYSTDATTHPKNGWEIFSAAFGYNDSAGSIFVEDHSAGGVNDTRKYEDSITSYTSSLDRSGSGQANGLTADMWTWFETVTGI